MNLRVRLALGGTPRGRGPLDDALSGRRKTKLASVTGRSRGVVNPARRDHALEIATQRRLLEIEAARDVRRSGSPGDSKRDEDVELRRADTMRAKLGIVDARHAAIELANAQREALTLHGARNSTDVVRADHS